MSISQYHFIKTLPENQVQAYKLAWMGSEKRTEKGAHFSWAWEGEWCLSPIDTNDKHRLYAAMTDKKKIALCLSFSLSVLALV